MKVYLGLGMLDIVAEWELGMLDIVVEWELGARHCGGIGAGRA